MMKKFLLFMASLCVFATTACGDASKVTDPADPRFKPENFRFEDYTDFSTKLDILKKIFPVGTSRKFVEMVLVDSGGAKISNDKKNPSVHYLYDIRHHIDGSWNITVYYDEQSNVAKLILDGTKVTN